MNFKIEKVIENYPNNDLLSIWKESFPDFHEIDEKRIKWAYRENICGKPQVWLLKDRLSEEYFGCSALIPRYFLINGRSLLGALFSDTGVKKKYRTLGPALTLHKEIINGSHDFKLIMAFPNEISEAILKRFRFRKATDLVYYIKILKSRVVIEKKIKSKYSRNLLLPFTLIADLGLQLLDFLTNLNKKTFESEHIQEFDNRTDSVFAQFKAKYEFVQDRNSKCMNWRYKNHPYRNYHIFVLKKQHSADLLGYVVYYIKDNRIFVDDFLWLEGYCTLKDLVNEFTISMRKKKFKSVTFVFAENSQLEKSFKGLGFFRTNSKLPLLYFSLDQGLFSNLSKAIQKSFITLGDRDY
jgi:hypothetical protein